jgi:nucleoside-diphosphate-sugar epimerase
MTLDNVLIIGCGDIGRRVAALARSEGATVTALVRSAEKGELLHTLGIGTVPGNLDDQDTLGSLPTRGSTVFYFAPPPGGGITDPRMRAFCAAVIPGNEPRKVVYISTTGVYGDCGGEVVTEETPVNPQTARARRRLDAETTLRAWGEEHNVAVIILRVTGIYGPGRLPVRHIAEGQPVLRPEEAPLTNRIHTDDLARICIAAAVRGEAGEIFNVSDGQAGTMTDYFNAVADAAGLPRPRQVTMAEAHQVMSPLMLSYVSESRQMDNRKMLEKLGIRLLYPDLASGLKASLEKG